jgi:hypothetical protein
VAFDAFSVEHNAAKTCSNLQNDLYLRPLISGYRALLHKQLILVVKFDFAACLLSGSA